MKPRIYSRFLLLLIALSLAAQADERTPWIHPLASGWTVHPLLNASEKAANGYAMTGIPDGLGALDNGDGTMTVLMNHELGATKGMVRAHGGKGGFVSRFVLRLSDFAVVEGGDLVQRVYLWRDDAYHANTNVTFGRFCSADLAPSSAFFDAASGLGFDGRILLNGEEEKDLGGRAFGHVVTGADAGSSFELPHLGRVAWENLLALPESGKRTVVVGIDDYPGGHVYVYVGEKRGSGNPAEKAGLVGGELYAVRFEDERFSLLSLGEVTGLDGKTLRARARELGATPLLRPEDGAWDKRDRNGFWFATTDKIDGLSQLYRLNFDDARQPEKGGQMRIVLTAKDIGGQMFDNIASDSDGRILIDEDPGESAFPSGIWLFDPAQPGRATRLFEADRARFVNAGNAEFMTEDEEQSGIVEITDEVKHAPWFEATRRYYLATLQAHLPHPDPAIVEHGQLFLISGPRR